MNKMKSLIGSLQAETPFTGSLSSAVIREVKLWLKTIPAERLEFFALYFPTESWRKLSDLCHLHPENDFPQSPWFLSFCFGCQELPDFLKSSNGMSEKNISELVMNSDIDYSIVRKYKDGLNKEAKTRIATYTKLDTVLWYYEELRNKRVNKVIAERLKNGEKINLPYGKLMERIIYMKFGENEKDIAFLDHLIRDANEKLKDIKFDLESPVSVIGDMSGSMDVAIRTSNIIASLLTAITNADLVFFDDKNEIPPFLPKDVPGVLKLCDLIKSRDSTIPAVSLYPYWKKRKVFKTFFIITDEEENGKHNKWDFANLFKRYHKDVYPSRLVFISFLQQHARGQMVDQLRKIAPEVDVVQFCFEKSRPDLSKLDHIFGLLSSEGVVFAKKVDDYQKLFENEDLQAAFGQLLNV